MRDMFKVSNKETRTTPGFIVNFEHVIAGWFDLRILQYGQEHFFDLTQGSFI